MEKNKMSVACSTYGGEERCTQVCSEEKWGKETTWKNQALKEDNIKMGFQEIGWGGMDCVDLVQDRDRTRASVNALINFWFP